MKQYILCSALLICIALSSCKKDGSSNQPPATGDKYQLTLLSGNNQTDTVGLNFKDSIIVKATNNGQPLNKYHLQLLRSGCNEDLVYDVYTNQKGLFSYSWKLSGNTGPQTLTIRLLDVNNKPLDSVTVNGTGLASKSIGWHISACTPFTTDLYSFCKLSTGRIFATFGRTYARYSDDNGISWFALKSLGNTHNIVSIIANYKDELIAFADREGMYYSKDAGLTWVFMGNTPFVNEVYWDLAFTGSGKLIYTSRQHHIYLSNDNGKTWKSLNNNGLADTEYTYPVEAKNGDLYLIGNSQVLFKSVDGGNNWQATNSLINNVSGFEQVSSFYCANNGWLYKGRQDPAGGLFLSKDNGLTYTQIVNSPYSFVTSPSIGPNGFVYFNILLSGLYVFDGKAAKRIWGEGNPGIGIKGTPYIIANNGAIIVSTNSPVIMYYK